MIMGWKVISDVLYQFLILIWPPDQPLVRFLIFQKKMLKCRFWPKMSSGAVREPEWSQIEKYRNMVFGTFQIRSFRWFSIQKSISYDIQIKTLETEKIFFTFFSFLTIFLTVYFTGLYRRHEKYVNMIFFKKLKSISRLVI